MFLLDLYLTNTVLVVILVGLIFIFHALLPDPGRCKIVEAEFPPVSVVIPARNEEANIGDCVRSLLAQDYPVFDIVVIDDRSADGTGRIAKELAEAHPTVKYVAKAEPPPPGWTGKCSALKEAVEHAGGEWLFFVDADTRHRPGSIRSALSFALENKAHMVSFWPLHKLGSFGAQFAMPVLWSSLFWNDPFHRVNDLSEEKSYSLGHGILIDKRAYTLVGGHQSVREWIIADSALAKMMKKKGLSVQIADGRKLFTVQVNDGLEALWHRWGKMLFALVDYRLLKLALVLIFINATLVMPFLQALAVAVMWAAGIAHPWLNQLTLLSLVQVGFVLSWMLRIAGHYEGLRWWWLPLLPASALFASAVYLYSTWLVLRRAQVKWRGRTYTVTRLSLPDSR